MSRRSSRNQNDGGYTSFPNAAGGGFNFGGYDMNPYDAMMQQNNQGFAGLQPDFGMAAPVPAPAPAKRGRKRKSAPAAVAAPAPAAAPPPPVNDGNALVAAALEDYYKEKEIDEDFGDRGGSGSKRKKKTKKEIETEPVEKERKPHPTGENHMNFKKAGFPFEHFVTLDEFRISKSNQKMSSHRLCVCKYCQAEYEELELSFKQKKIFTAPDPPKKLMRARRDLALHLKKCPIFKRDFADEWDENFANGANDPTKRKSSASAASAAAGGTPKNPKKAAKVKREATPAAPRSAPPKSSTIVSLSSNLSPSLIRNIQMHLVEFILENKLDVGIVKQPSFQRLFQSMLPRNSAYGVLPLTPNDFFKLVIDRSNHAASAMDRGIMDILTKRKHRAGLIITEYQKNWDDNNKAALACKLSAGGEQFTLNPAAEEEEKKKKAEQSKDEKDGCDEAKEDSDEDDDESSPDNSGDRNDLIEVVRAWERIINLYKEKYNFAYVVSKETELFPETRRILALRHPHVIFNRCWANQTLIMMAKALLASTDFTVTAIHASTVVQVLNTSPKYFHFFTTAVHKVYGKNTSAELYDNDIVSHFVSSESCWWYTTQANMASLLRVKNGMQEFVSENATLPGFPSQFFILNDDEFWYKLERAESYLRPFCDISNLLKDEKASMAQVVFILLKLRKHFGANDPDEMAQTIVEDLECRWAREENPLFFLAFALHPLYRKTAVAILKASHDRYGSWTAHRNALTIPRLVKAGKFYYGKFKVFKSDSEEERDTEVKMFSKLLWQWLKGKDFDVSEFVPNENVVDWWEENALELEYLSDFSKFLLGAPVQTASCEELFHKLGRVDTISSTSEAEQEKQRKIQIIREHMRVMYRQKSQGTSDHIVSSKEYEMVPEEEREYNEYGTADDDHKKGTKDPSNNRDSEKPAGLCRSYYNSLGEIDSNNLWVSMYDRAVPLNDDEEYYKHNDDDDDDNDDKDEDDEGYDSAEDDDYEIQTDPLPPLLEVKQAKYPQENKEYFKSKKYVRKDKYALHKMLLDDADDTGHNAVDV